MSLVAGVTVCICTYRRPGALVRALESVAGQEEAPLETIVVDGSPGDDTGDAVERLLAGGTFPGTLRYLKVGGEQRGLTRQRNVALAATTTDLVAFFDDDVVLLPGALAAMARVHREHSPAPAGVAAVIENELHAPPAKWRLRRMLGAVPSLRAGQYARSGMSIPWNFLPRAAGVTAGDWLPGGATMWRTAAAAATGFDGSLTGYANGEDLEFSRRISVVGPLLMCPAARVHHLHEAGGRPDARHLGYTTVLNSWRIHRGLRGRSGLDVARFAYAHALELAFLAAGAIRAADAGRRDYLRGYADGLRVLFITRGR